MATKRSTVDVILEQAAGAGGLSAKRMFGEYGIYRGDRLVALVCDDRLFMKPTEAGRACLGSVTEALPYPGAKPCFLVPGKAWDDADRLAELFRVTAEALPKPGPGRARAGKGRRHRTCDDPSGGET